MEKIPPEKRSPTIESKFFRNPRFSPNPRIFGRTGLLISLSRPKLDEQVDFDTRSAVARPKPRPIGEKQNFWSKIFAEKFFSASKNEMSEIVWNVFWQSFVAIRALLKKFRKKNHLQSLDVYFMDSFIPARDWKWFSPGSLQAQRSVRRPRDVRMWGCSRDLKALGVRRP